MMEDARLSAAVDRPWAHGWCSKLDGHVLPVGWAIVTWRPLRSPYASGVSRQDTDCRQASALDRPPAIDESMR
jgi:hypothetical protein